MDNYDACGLLREQYGKKIGIIIIGIAGERQYPIATCAVADSDGIPARHAGRGGMGAVMGSKRLKAVLIDDSKASAVDYTDKETFFALSKEWAKECIESKKLITKLGTSNLVLTTNRMGCLATRNFTQGSFEGAAEISGEKMYETILARGGNPTHGCYPGCVVRCSNVYNGPDGKHLTSSLEFETLVLMGSNLAIADLDAVARLDRFCDGFGADTMDLGAAIGTAMQGGVINFGDIEGVMGLIEEVKQNTILGRRRRRAAATGVPAPSRPTHRSSSRAAGSG
jgi:aldehyde:ferredoxin oxidoreductase